MSKKVTIDAREEAKLKLRAQVHGDSKIAKKAVQKEVVEKEVIKEVKRAIEVDHVVITQFRNDDKKPTLFADAKGKFISVDDKAGFKKANEKGGLKLTLEEAIKVVEKLPEDAELIEVSPAFTIEQFKALTAE